ncbi:DUF2000 domain-containing protein [Candidatus Bathyarchaeota archaeon]|jgi:hypothetical protein|nr:DUF2000 domain-containing protein [Candidatus Bathyarchaeota archaeon]MBT4423711.1 DUF2000 domain-containing protein [Candidatus Bathyarchaeota archaeon]MBT5642740.1 DUF2000 domain-containing protein [Candidatus Bathyarchaeota archaeon]MBT6605236.1 DUF2000 domain-containing protein [Candidatus Bathyarchaeota archaeon]
MSSIAIILKRDLPSGLIGNVCACLATGITGINPDINGPDFEAHGLTYKGITKVPIVVVTENALGIDEVLKRCVKRKMDFVLYDGKAIKERSYSNYMKVVKLNPPEKREVLGIGVIGEPDRVRKIIGDLPLLR